MLTYLNTRIFLLLLGGLSDRDSGGRDVGSRICSRSGVGEAAAESIFCTTTGCSNQVLVYLVGALDGLSSGVCGCGCVCFCAPSCSTLVCVRGRYHQVVHSSSDEAHVGGTIHTTRLSVAHPRRTQTVRGVSTTRWWCRQCRFHRTGRQTRRFVTVAKWNQALSSLSMTGSDSFQLFLSSPSFVRFLVFF